MGIGKRGMKESVKRRSKMKRRERRKAKSKDGRRYNSQ